MLETYTHGPYTYKFTGWKLRYNGDFEIVDRSITAQWVAWRKGAKKSAFVNCVSPEKYRGWYEQGEAFFDAEVDKDAFFGVPLTHDIKALAEFVNLLASAEVRARVLLLEMLDNGEPE